VTLKKLKGMCLTEIGNLQPTNVIPDIVATINKFLRELARFVGGIPSTSTFLTTAGTREYGPSTTGFPSDAQKYYRVYRSDGFILEPTFRRERNDLSTSSGSPLRYYLWGNLIGLEPIPNGIDSITAEYYGVGSTLSGDSDLVFPTLQVQDADPFWDAVIYAFASQYFRLTRDFEKMQYYTTEKLKAQWEARKVVLSVNADRLVKIDLPEHYFERLDGTSFPERLANEGDVLRQI